jgi:hypothetical protein
LLNYFNKKSPGHQRVRSFSISIFLSFFAKIADLLAEFSFHHMLRHLFLWVPISLCWADSSPMQEDKVAIARQRVTPILVQRFAAAGLPYPAQSEKRFSSLSANQLPKCSRSAEI